LKSEEKFEDSECEWKRGDVNSMSHILDRLNTRVPASKDESKALQTTVDKLLSSIDKRKFFLRI
jgi:hypothetical protein